MKESSKELIKLVFSVVKFIAAAILGYYGGNAMF